MNVFWLIALVNLVPVAIVIATSPLRGLSRVLSPDTQLIAVFYAIFSIRPLFGDRFQSSRSSYSGFYGFVPTYQGQMTASLVGMSLLWSTAIGAFFYTLYRNDRTEATPFTVSSVVDPSPDRECPQKLPHVRALVGTSAALAIYFLTLVIYLGVGRVLAMTRGRSAESAPKGVPEIVGVLPLAGSIAAATLILMARSRPIGIGAWFSITACTALSLITVSQLGTRRFMIPSLLIVITALLMRKPVRLRLRHMVLGVMAVAVFAVVPYVRSEGNRQGKNLAQAIVRYFEDVGLLGSLRNIFTTYDTEMYDYIAVIAPRLSTGRADYGWGKGTLIEFLTHPLPANILESVERSNEVRGYLFNYSCGIGCGLPFPVPSWGGVLYFDGWYFGVVVGGILGGVVVRWLAMRWSHAPSSTVAQNVMTAICVSYVGVAARTETITALWLCIYSAAVGVVVIVVMGARTGESGARRSLDGGGEILGCFGPQDRGEEDLAQMGARGSARRN